MSNATVHVISGPALARGEVLVHDGKIVAVGTRLDATGARVIDLQGQQLYPGLIAAGTTLGLTEIAGVRATRDSNEAGDYGPDVQSWIAVNPDSELISVARANGITHIEPVPQGGVVAGQSAVIALDGWTSEQMAVKRPVALHVFWPESTLNTSPRSQSRDAAKWKSLDDQSRERRLKLRSMEDFFEEARAYAKAKLAAGEKFFVVPAWEAMVPYVRGELPVIVHANDARQIKAALAWAEAGRYRLVIAGGRDAWIVAEALASEKVPVIYDQVFAQPFRDTDPYDLPFKAPSILQKAGVKVVFSHGLSGMQAATVRNLPYTAAQAMAFGLPEIEALRGITLYAAQTLGVADRLGSIEAGKDATFFVADGGILDIRSHVTQMWIAGREVSLESKQTRLYEKYRNRPRP
ncbi:MAG: amidohydrolase family protein [Opitutaceae bacterium]|nr:amidohydrolase family protein [Verrucomicrobiales bacterium]